MAVQRFPVDDARRLGTEIGIDRASSPFDAEQQRQGLEVELEHGAHDPETGDNLVMTARIAWAHLKELPDYYTRLATMETQGVQ